MTPEHINRPTVAPWLATSPAGALAALFNPANPSIVMPQPDDKSSAVIGLEVVAAKPQPLTPSEEKELRRYDREIEQGKRIVAGGFRRGGWAFLWAGQRAG